MFDFVNMIGLALIPAVLWLAIDVMRHYWPVLLSKPFDEFKGEDFLRLGVVVSFASAGFLNVIFWGSHFMSEFMEWERGIRLTYLSGQAANIVTRYLPYIVASVLHLYAAWKYNVTGARHPTYYLLRSIGLTLVALALLEWLGPS